MTAPLTLTTKTSRQPTQEQRLAQAIHPGRGIGASGADKGAVAR